MQSVREAYPKLWKLIGVPDGQVIWCYTSTDGIVKTGIRKTLWELEIPDCEIIAFVDAIVWNRILGIKCALPSAIRTRWLSEAIKRFSKNAGKRDAYMDEVRDEFWCQKPPTGDWWDSLLVSPRSGEYVSAIIKHPVSQEWVLRKRIWQCPTKPCT